MKILVWFLLWLVVLFSFVPIALAQDSGVDKHIQELQSKIVELQGQENSLSKQIGLLNSNIALTTLRIDSSRVLIKQLSSEIDSIGSEIDKLEELKTKRLELVLHRIPEAYKRSVAPQFGLILFSQNFSDFLSRVKYVDSVQQQDALLYRKLQETQTHFNERRAQREQKKTQQEALKQKLEQDTIELNKQKREKQELLDQTKNSEVVYQKLLAQALAEKQALDRALVDSAKIGPVKKGDPIALFGNTGYPGCSSGAHLHFEMHKNGSWTNAEEYLAPRTVADSQNGGTATVGSGSWDWPLEGDIIVTQHYGKTPYSWRYSYSGGIHTGVDMVSNTSSVIRAPRDGVLYASSQACGSSIIKIKYIDHGDGLLSFYLHVQ